MLDIKDAIVPAIVAGGVALLGILVIWYFVTKKYAARDNRAKQEDKIIRKPQDKVIRKEAKESIPEAKKVKVAPLVDTFKPKKQSKPITLIPLIGAGVCFTGGALIAGWLMVAGFMALMVGIAVLIQSLIQGVNRGNNPTVNDTVTRGNEALPDIQRRKRVRSPKAPPQQPGLEGIGTVKGAKNAGNKGA